MNFLFVAIEQIFSPTSHNHRCFNFASCALRVNNSVVDLLCCVCLGVVLFVNILLTVEEEAVREPDNYFTGRRKLPLCGLGVIIHSNGADGVTGACCCSPCNRPVVNCFGGVHFIVSFQGPRTFTRGLLICGKMFGYIEMLTSHKRFTNVHPAILTHIW